MALNFAPGIVTQSSVSAAAAETEYCYTWSLSNQTGQDVNGLEVKAGGIETVLRVYEGAGNPFGPPASTSSASNILTLKFGGTDATVIPPAEPVQMGLCAPTAVSGVQFTWLQGSTTVQPALVAPGLAWTWPNTGTLQLQLTNSTGISATLLALDVLAPESTLGVDEMEPVTAASLPLAARLNEDPLDMLPNAVLTFTTAFEGAVEPVAPGNPYLIQVQLASIEDPSVTVDLFVQLVAPAAPRIFLPLIQNN